MKEVCTLAERYSLEQRLYHINSGVGKVRELVGISRYDKVLTKNPVLWDKMSESFHREFGDIQLCLVDEMANQLQCSSKQEVPCKEKSENFLA